jgi:hypothetical protein
MGMWHLSYRITTKRKYAVINEREFDPFALAVEREQYQSSFARE